MVKIRHQLDITDNRSFVQMALDVHMTKTGAFERSLEEQERDVFILQKVIENWEPPVHNPEFDEACRNMIEAALAEQGWYQ